MDGLYVLENSAVEINGWTFLGAVLWSDLKEIPILNQNKIREMMNDYHFIKYNHKTLDLQDTTNLFYKSLNWLYNMLDLDLPPKYKKHAVKTNNFRENISKTYPEINRSKTIIITHHLPSFKSVVPKYRNSPLNPAFASNLDSLIEDSEVPLWIHGHTHSSLDYKIKSTRILCNPRGYPGYEENPLFNSQMIINI